MKERNLEEKTVVVERENYQDLNGVVEEIGRTQNHEGDATYVRVVEIAQPLLRGSKSKEPRCTVAVWRISLVHVVVQE